MKKILLVCAALLSFAESGEAQQRLMLSQYMFNGLVLNPAYAGSKEFVSTAIAVRKQWAGFEGAPFSQSASIHGLLKNKKVGLGFMIVNDHIGITNSTEVYGSYAYHLRFRKSRLAMGIQAGITSYTSKLSDLVFWDPNDKVYEIPTLSSLLPNFGGGIYYYSEYYYAGLSLPFSISYSPLDNLGVKIIDNGYNLTRHYYFTAGGMIGKSRTLKARPSVLVKYVENAPVQYDLNLNFLINEIFWVGASYRSEDAVVAIFEFQASRKLRIGYSADYTLGRLKNYSAGSHEIMLGYDFGYNILKMKTPRYF